MIYNLYIYNNSGKCLYYKEWYRPLNTLADDPVEEKKLMFGMLHSLKDLALKLSPSVGSEGLHTVKTNAFTLHHYSSVTGITLVLNTDHTTPDMYQNLHYIYTSIFVETLTKNPLYRYVPGTSISCPLFDKKIEEYISSLPQ